MMHSIRIALSSAALLVVLPSLPGCKESPQAPAVEIEEASVDAAGLDLPPPSPSMLESIEPVTPLRIAGVKARLDRHLRRYALRSPENTWALIHALLVYPPDTKLPEHDMTLLDAILSEATVVEVGGRVVPTFAGEAADGTPREPHANQVVKVLLGMGIELDHPFEAGGRRFTVSDLVDSALWRFEPPAGEHWEHESWTLSALARSRRHSEESGFTNYKGQRFEAMDLVQRAAAHLNREMEFIELAQRTGRPLEKRREGVHAHPCGGLHLARTPTDWMRDERRSAVLMPAMQRAAATLAWRVTAEHEVYERTRREHPSHDLMISAQEMKFYGHWLETMYDLRRAGVEIDEESIEHGIALLVQAVERLDRMSTFQRMDDVRVRRVQTYRDLIGDSAHALRGLRLWTED